MGHGAPVKGDEGTVTEKSAGASGATEDAEMAVFDVTENDVRRCNRFAEPFVKRRLLVLIQWIRLYRLEHASVKRMRLSKNAGGFDATPMLLPSPMAFLAQYFAIAHSIAKSTGLRALETLRLVEEARGAQEKLKHMALSMDERGMPREVGSPSQELDVAHVGTRPQRNKQASWKQPLAEAATRCEPLINSAARLSQLAHDA